MPRRFPIVQFPNRSLIIGMATDAFARSHTGWARRLAALVSRIVMLYWSAQELVSGVNWFRRLVGVAVGARAAGALVRSLRRL
jgi:hypothetical protein